MAPRRRGVDPSVERVMATTFGPRAFAWQNGKDLPHRCYSDAADAVVRNAQGLYRYLAVRLDGDDSLAEDLMQELCLQAARSALPQSANRQSDRILHENLQALAQRMNRPPNASPEQVAHWAELARPRHRPGTLRGLQFIRKYPLQSLLSSGAAAAIIIATIIFGLHLAAPRPVSAKDIFAQVANTIAARPVVHVVVNNLACAQHRITVRLYSGDAGKRTYAHLLVQPLSTTDHPSIQANMIFAREGQKAWLLIRKLRCNEISPLGEAIPADGALLVRWDLSRPSQWATEKNFPLAVRLEDIQALMESLRKAVSKLTVKRLPNDFLQLEGTITSPGALDLQAIGQAVDVVRVVDTFASGRVVSTLHARIVKVADAAKIALAFQLRPEDVESVNRQIDMLARLATEEIKRQYKLRKPTRKQRLIWRTNLRNLAANSQLKINYDPIKKHLTNVTIAEIGPLLGSVSISFVGKTFDKSLLDSRRFENHPGVRVMTRKQFLLTVIGQLEPFKTEDTSEKYNRSRKNIR
ncbi:MAG: hypothetical protein QF792_07315 [Phycisphaerae bacterium]|nr:hypothetical protein [Phycisphaerae bacterium]